MSARDRKTKSLGKETSRLMMSPPLGGRYSRREGAARPTRGVAKKPSAKR